MDERCKESGAVADARLRLIQAKQWDFSVINYDRIKYGELRKRIDAKEKKMMD